MWSGEKHLKEMILHVTLNLFTPLEKVTFPNRFKEERSHLLRISGQAFCKAAKDSESVFIILLWGLGVNATANVGRKRGLLLPKALEINLERSQRKTLPWMTYSLLYMSVAISRCYFVIAKSQSKSDQQRFLKRMWVCFLSLELFSYL